MKTKEAMYWISTGVFSSWMLANAFGYFFSTEAKTLCAHFGFPDYFRIELGIAKLLGVLALWYPTGWHVFREWAYAGFFITIVSGSIAHLASGDPVRSLLSCLVAFAILLTSYITFRRMQTLRSDRLCSYDPF